MRTFDEIVQIVLQLKQDQGPTIQKMKDVLDRYDGDWVLPIPSLADEPALPPMTPALVGEAVDTMAMRASGVRPRVTSPAIKPNKDTGTGSRQFARKREEIIDATYHASKWSLGRRRFYRQLAAYHTGSLVVIPNFKLKLPMLEVRDPLGTFAEPLAHEQLRTPEYVAFVTRHSGNYLVKRYPTLHANAGGPIPIDGLSDLWDCVEWYDEEQIVFGLVGPATSTGTGGNAYYRHHLAVPSWQQISPSFPNRAGLVPAVVPHNVSLGKIASRLASMLGIVDLQAKLTALDIMAQEKAIFPDMYAIGRQNGQPQVIGGNGWQDGRTGEMNILHDIEQVGLIRSTPDNRTSATIDRQERAFRISTGLTAASGGENYSNLRTGRALDSMEGIAVDPRIQELHEISEAYMPHVNEAIFETYKGYWPNKQYSLFTGRDGASGMTEFEPAVHIETTANTVSYAIAGADVAQQTQILGSLRGVGAISGRTFRVMHPWIKNAEEEGRLVDEEQFEQALKQTVLEQIATGQMPLMIAVIIRDELAKGKDIFDALRKADEKAAEAQAEQPAPQDPAAMPGLAAGPGALMPGGQMPPAGPPPEPGAPVGAEAENIQVPGDVTRMRALVRQMATN